MPQKKPRAPHKFRPRAGFEARFFLLAKTGFANAWIIARLGKPLPLDGLDFGLRRDESFLLIKMRFFNPGDAGVYHKHDRFEAGYGNAH